YAGSGRFKCWNRSARRKLAPSWKRSREEPRQPATRKRPKRPWSAWREKHPRRTRRDTKNESKLADEPFPFQFAGASKVNQQADTEPCDFEIIEDLRLLFCRQAIQRLDFHDDLAITHQISDIFFPELAPLVSNHQGFLRLEWQASV